jgi:hypothetical protein
MIDRTRCRVCGEPSTRAWPDGFYCDSDECIALRTWGKRLDPAKPRAGHCSPGRCYCGVFSCPAFHSYRLTTLAPELFRGQGHVAALEARAALMARRAAAAAERQRATLSGLRDEWDQRDETWLDRL